MGRAKGRNIVFLFGFQFHLQNVLISSSTQLVTQILKEIASIAADASLSKSTSDLEWDILGGRVDIMIYIYDD